MNMNEGATEFAPPRDVGNRATQLRQGSRNASMSEGGGTVSYGLDEQLFVEFYPEQVHMEYLSKQAGSPIFQERIFTRIIMPGNRLTVVVHQTKGITYETVQDPDSGEFHTNWDVMEQQENGDPVEPDKYPNAWRRFMKVGISADNGLPVEQWGVITRSYAASLKAQNIHTVEALAGLSDQMAQNIMGAVKYRDLARAHLDEKERTRVVSKAQEAATAAEERSLIQARQIEALQAEVMRLQHAMTQGPQQGFGGDQRPMTAHEIGELNSQRQVQGTHHPGGVRKVSVADAKKKHQIPPGKPGEAA